MMFTYLGTLVVGVELIQVAYLGRTARYVSTNQAGNSQVYDETLPGTLPMRIACLRHLLESIPPGMAAFAVHPGAHGAQFFEDFRACRDALVFEHQD